MRPKPGFLTRFLAVLAIFSLLVDPAAAVLSPSSQPQVIRLQSSPFVLQALSASSGFFTHPSLRHKTSSNILRSITPSGKEPWVPVSRSWMNGPWVAPADRVTSPLFNHPARHATGNEDLQKRVPDFRMLSDTEIQSKTVDELGEIMAEATQEWTQASQRLVDAKQRLEDLTPEDNYRAATRVPEHLWPLITDAKLELSKARRHLDDVTRYAKSIRLRMVELRRALPAIDPGLSDTGKNGERYQTVRLDRAFAERHRAALVDLVRLVQGSERTEEYVFNLPSAAWDSSVAAVDGRGQLVGILIAFPQDSQSMYGWRLCVAPEHRRNRLALLLLRRFLSNVEASQKGLAFTLQTDAANPEGNSLYQAIGIPKRQTLLVGDHEEIVYSAPVSRWLEGVDRLLARSVVNSRAEPNANLNRDEPKRGYWTVQDGRSRRNQGDPLRGRWVAPNLERRGFHGLAGVPGYVRRNEDAQNKPRLGVAREPSTALFKKGREILDKESTLEELHQFSQAIAQYNQALEAGVIRGERYSAASMLLELNRHPANDDVYLDQSRRISTLPDAYEAVEDVIIADGLYSGIHNGRYLDPEDLTAALPTLRRLVSWVEVSEAAARPHPRESDFKTALARLTLGFYECVIPDLSPLSDEWEPPRDGWREFQGLLTSKGALMGRILRDQITIEKRRRTVSMFGLRWDSAELLARALPVAVKKRVSLDQVVLYPERIPELGEVFDEARRKTKLENLGDGPIEYDPEFLTKMRTLADRLDPSGSDGFIVRRLIRWLQYHLPWRRSATTPRSILSAA